MGYRSVELKGGIPEWPPNDKRRTALGDFQEPLFPWHDPCQRVRRSKFWYWSPDCKGWVRYHRDNGVVPRGGTVWESSVIWWRFTLPLHPLSQSQQHPGSLGSVSRHTLFVHINPLKSIEQ